MSIITSDPAQPLRALARANAIRSERAELKLQIAAGDTSVVEVLTTLPSCARSWQIGGLLAAQEHWGPARARRMLNELHIPEIKPAGTLTARQRMVITEQLQPPAAPAPRRCKVCGCLDAAACTKLGALTDRIVCCHWVSEDVCSACLEEQLARAGGFDPTGTTWTHPPLERTNTIASEAGR